ncbi:Cutinase OS=Tsukamurella paurometabola (strain ATCC 8368 / DSM / CCUG 35730 / CIP 100753 / JCM 10117 / KCTC 9821 / NBRC 16120 / NCIMB 702349 / NCTC 13040)OX=521096 GN=Tpau_0171 PE=4 SV=1 [Tsukamurella paurometabola]|uniref:Cutinase n=1 Tax=Tsukamurella paurometabola (strain ATCC 8368 / DSM 20162 / CCUG 35730 / CIP 100753 / JCM 10117 / KCTC 9821 / NBRC 16120 / NCIMB 702349 / NCTC 13040) TaxID=521096 RepID=D5UQJ2_TSUPD|nr:cutinase family protein [Tsukamurella paurometabola]ADG76825.1 cutinase precursor [Tsukamurella paurometabola DSM 20162]SUP41797.1 Cutinase [Tsukamurella paurometabola]
MAGNGKRALNVMGIAIAIAALIAIIVVIALIISMLNKPGPTPPGPPGGQQAADCPDVQVISIPGTWESSATDDPVNPRFNPRSLMLQVSTPLAKRYPKLRADIWTVPYVAQFHNPVAVPPDGQMTYAASRQQGTDRAIAQINKVNERCGRTGFVLMGFSQGATIAGNIAAQIGAGQGPVAAERLIGVGLISDSRRVQGEGRAIGPDPAGEGVEVTFSGFNAFGVDLQGKRKGGFGAVDDKVVTICGSNDPICNQPKGGLLGLATGLPQVISTVTQNSHAAYGTTSDWSLDGKTATQWLTGWAIGVIDKAPKTK